jgi:hypothetical protein
VPGILHEALSTKEFLLTSARIRSLIEKIRRPSQNIEELSREAARQRPSHWMSQNVKE